MRRIGDVLAPLLLVAALLAAWEIGCRASGVPVYRLPPPSAVGKALVENLPLLLQSAWNTLRMALWGLAFASISAMAVALAASLHHLLERAVRPVAIALQVTPVVAIAPLVSIWAGLDHPERAVIGLAAVVSFFPVLSGALAGFKAADPDLRRLFRLYGASRVQTLMRLELPSAAPFLAAGHKVAAGLAVVGAVVAELAAGSGGSQGLAWRILESANRLRTAETFAALAVLTVLGLLVYAAMSAIERWVTGRWRPPVRTA